MPHVNVKLWPGRSAEIKKQLADEIAKTVALNLSVDIGDVSVAIEEIEREQWGEMVYKNEIKSNPNIYHKPYYEYS